MLAFFKIEILSFIFRGGLNKDYNDTSTTPIRHAVNELW